MRATKKAQQGNGQAEIVEAVRALAQEKDISVDMLFSAIEEALKAAYKKNVSRDENAPSNLSVTIDRSTGVVHVFARKTITDVVEDSVTGLLVPSGGTNAMAQALWSLYTDAARGCSFAQSARRRALKNFGIDAMVRSCERLFFGKQRGESGRSVPGYFG